MKKSKYYHITENLKSWMSISQSGIKANELGEIFVFSKKEVAPYMAKNQLLLSNYVLVEIDSDGITGEIIEDNVGELTAKYQFIVKQDLIKPEYISMVDAFFVE